MKTILIGQSSNISKEIYKYISKSQKVIVTQKKNKKLNSYLDVLDENSIKKFFSQNKIKNIDGIIYCAGITKKKTHIQKFNPDDFSDIVNVNIRGLLLFLKYSYKYLKKNKSKIVVINSIAAKTYSKSSDVSYTISKSGVSGLVRQLAIDFSVDGILINAINPGPVKTEMLQTILSKNEIKKLKSYIPLKKLTTVTDVANAVKFLISSENKQITGCSIDINGGEYLSA